MAKMAVSRTNSDSTTLMRLGSSLRPTSSRPALRMVPATSEPTTASLSVEVLRGDATIIGQIASEWNDLCLEGPSNLPFLTPLWISTWIESFAPSAKLVLLTARRGGKLRGILPFIEERTGLPGFRLTRLIQPANVHSNQIDLIHGANDRNAIVRELWNALRTEVPWDVIEYRDVPDSGGFQHMARIAASIGFPVIERKTLESPVITLSPQTNLSKLGPAKDLRRSRRMFERAGGYEYIRHEPVDLQRVNQLFEMEASGWKGDNGSAILFHEEQRRFYTSIMTRRTESAVPVIHELRFQGEPIALHFGIEMGDRYVGPKGTYAESQKSYGPGHVIIHEIATRLLARGFTSFGLLGHTEPYKELWTSDTQTHYQYLIFRKSPAGRALRWGVETLIPWAKRWQAWTLRPRVDAFKESRIGKATIGTTT